MRGDSGVVDARDGHLYCHPCWQQYEAGALDASRNTALLLAIKEGQKVGSAVLHAGAIQSGQRLIFGVVVTRYVGPGPHDQVAFHKAILEAYGILRGVEPLQ